MNGKKSCKQLISDKKYQRFIAKEINMALPSRVDFVCTAGANPIKIYD
jgi:hypothetical protein